MNARYFDNIDVGTEFKRCESRFRKTDKDNAICLESGYDFDKVGETYYFGCCVSVTPVTAYKSQAARDAQAAGVGDKAYWDYLDQSSQEHHDYYMREGNEARAKLMLTQSLGEALQGNEGN